MRTASGVPGFDALVQGGFPDGASVVVQGPAGAEKDALVVRKNGWLEKYLPGLFARKEE